MKKNKVLALLLALAMVLTCMPVMAFADPGDITYTDISIGNRVDITFDEEGNSQFFKLDVPESGFYKLNLYQDYDVSYNKYFWVGVYNSTDFDEPSLDTLHWANLDTDETDYVIFKLDAGTKYVEAQNFDSEGTQNKLGIEFEKTDGYEVDFGAVAYVGQQLWGSVYNVDNYEERATIDKVVVSDPSKAAIKVDTWTEDGKEYKDYSLKAKAAGKVTVTVDFTKPDGEKAQKDSTILIKKYPNQIKSLKVNGKTVKVSKNKFNYSKRYKGTKTTLKLALKKGWKVTSIWAYKYTKSGKEVNLVKSDAAMNKLVKLLNKGKAISFKFEKKYKYIYYGFSMEKGDDFIDYTIDLYR